jgi:hypothetical protein
MRRDGPRARQIAELCATTDPPVEGIDGRRLEGWGDDLMPPEDASPEQIVAHMRELASLMGPRKPRDRAALVLAARGFPCARLRSALLPFFDGFDVPSSTLDVGTAVEHDAAFAIIEATAAAYEQLLLGSLPEGMAKPLRRQVLDRVATVAKGRDESPDVVLHSLATNLVHASVADSDAEAFYDENVVAGVAGITRDEVQAGALRALAMACRFGPALRRVFVEAAPLELLSALAHVPALRLGLDEANAAKLGPILFALLAFVAAEQGHPSPADAVADLLGTLLGISISVPPDFAALVVVTMDQGAPAVGIGTDRRAATDATPSATAPTRR